MTQMQGASRAIGSDVMYGSQNISLISKHHRFDLQGALVMIGNPLATINGIGVGVAGTAAWVEETQASGKRRELAA